MASIPANILTVSGLTRQIKDTLENSFRGVAVSGEISNYKKHTSGHLYFTLKDQDAQLSAVMFRGNTMKLFFSLQDGMEVVCRGDVTVYEPRGNYQILVKEIYPRGEGALQLAFERLKKKLFEEGLFDESRKKPLPPFPERIAIVTSPTGAAIRDMISVMRRRFPSVEIVLLPVQVQGSGAAGQIAEAIDACNAFRSFDLIIVGRGGGSIEDLWAFNEEIVARAIHRSEIPVVSAVGHEIDFTICDFVADVRAATPSVAAELIAPDAQSLLESLRNISYTCIGSVNNRIQQLLRSLSSLSGHHAFLRCEEILTRHTQNLDERYAAAERTIDHRFERINSELTFYQRQLHAFNPKTLLDRGYAIPRKDGIIVRSVHEIHPGDQMHVLLRDGSIESQVHHILPNHEQEKK